MLRKRSFGPFFAGNLLSNCGTWVQNLAQAVLVFRVTDSTFLVGVVGFSQFAAIVLLAPWTGPAADHFDRRRLVIATQATATAVTLTLALLSFLGLATVPVVIALAFVIGITLAVTAPALGALVPDLVDRDEEVRPAVALNSFTFTAGRAIGPLIGAALVDVSLTLAFTVNSLSYLLLVAGLLVVGRRPQRASPGSGDDRSLRAGLALVRADPRLTRLLFGIAAIAIATDPVATLGPAFATRILGRPDAFAGILGGAFGTGAMITTLLVARRLHARDAQVGVAMIGLAGTATLFALSFRPWVAVIGLLGAGAFFAMANSLATSSIQLHTPDHLRGRVMALWSIAFLGVRPVVSLLDGALAAIGGVRFAAVAMGLPPVVTGVGILAAETLARDQRVMKRG